ncbi:putative argininosuccinate synthase [Pisolithus marmoratus]|nr:putative argininosuccinate synthase [Pisolithus marmoratus]
MASTSKGRVLLAYSGGLDTSCILAWLIEQGYEVIAFMADVGQEEDFEAARKKALAVGAKKFYLHDLKREFVTELIYPAMQANCIYEVSCTVSFLRRDRHHGMQNVYLLGTSLALADTEGCDYVSHGCTGKGNDQVRFELAFYGLRPDIKVIAPWRMPGTIPVQQTTAKPWSTDENLFHISYEAGILEDPNVTPPHDMWQLTTSPEAAPAEPERLSIEFKAGPPNQKTFTDPVEIFWVLNALARKHGVGRINIVENRFIGVKSHLSCAAAHMDIEGLTLDRNVRALRDQFVTIEFSRILYNGTFFSPEREFITSAIPASQRTGNVIIEGRYSEEGLYDEAQSSMDELGGFEPTDTSGFIQIQSIRIKKWAQSNIRKGQGGVRAKDVYGSRA